MIKLLEEEETPQQDKDNVAALERFLVEQKLPPHEVISALTSILVKVVYQHSRKNERLIMVKKIMLAMRAGVKKYIEWGNETDLQQNKPS